MKIYVLDLQLTRTQKAAATLGLGAALVIGANVSSADVPNQFQSGQVLTAAALNENFEDLDARIGQVGIPSGMIAPFAGEVAPDGWLACDGAEVNRADNMALFTAIGVTFGAGDSVTTFNIPDLRGRAVLGSGEGPGLTERVAGATGGGETITLTTNNMPAHSHTISDPGHSHGIMDPGHAHPLFISGGSNGWYYNNATFSSASASNGSSANATTGISVNNASTGITGTQSAGSGAPVSKMNPYLVTQYIIKR